MGGQIEVTPEALHQHAADVKSFMGDMNSAASSAGVDVSLDSLQTFGLIGMTWAGILTHWTGSAADFLKTTTAAGEHVADQVTKMATAYTDADSGSAKSLTAIKSEDTKS